MANRRQDGLEDPRELLEQHEQEVLEADLHRAFIEVAAIMLDPSNLPEEREVYRAELRDVRCILCRVQRQNGTTLALDPRTYDADSGDEAAELTEWDVYRLAWEGTSIPDHIFAAAVVGDSDLGLEY